MDISVRTQNLFIFISLVKLIHSHRKYSRKPFSGGDSRSVIYSPPPLPLRQLPQVDIVVLSHSHYDHT